MGAFMAANGYYQGDDTLWKHINEGTADQVKTVQHLFYTRDLNRVPCEAIDIGSLERYQRPMPVMNEYDQLLIAGCWR